MRGGASKFTAGFHDDDARALPVMTDSSAPTLDLKSMRLARQSTMKAQEEAEIARAASRGVTLTDDLREANQALCEAAGEGRWLWRAGQRPVAAVAWCSDT